MQALLPFVVFIIAVYAQAEYTPDNYPNPRRGGFKECKMRSASNVCDPEETLTESERYRINAELTKFSKTTEEGGNTFCTRKGTDVIFVIVQEASPEFAKHLREKWEMDRQCGRNGILVLSVNDRNLYASFDSRSPISDDKAQAVIASTDELFKTGSYTSAVVQILKQLGARDDLYSNTTKRPVDNEKSASPFSIMLTIVVAVSYLRLF
ncbi:unnamed protein product [Caenorhabditis bovis]|uniref:TPM domain-containing protein n=1 Tax=Caenorhabditis bovis TaxID=2654633 RepID=A0A8S1EAL4_9PELO|nr:unnamed protein product [Caenorhabditis bovis]